MDIWFDRQANPIDAATANERLGDMAYVRVGLTRVTSATDPAVDYRISTVWLGVNHNFLGGTPPILFETMVFGGPEEQDQSQWRWGTEAQALAGHAEIVTSVAATVTDAVVEEAQDSPAPELVAVVVGQQAAGRSILDRIDDTLDDWHGSKDAMHWSPGDQQEPDAADLFGLAAQRAADSFTAAMSRLTTQAAESPASINAIGHALLNLNADALATSFGFAPPGSDPRDDAAFTAVDPGHFRRILFGNVVLQSFGALSETINRAAQAEHDAQLAAANRLAWSGPNQMQRQIARAFGIPTALLMPTCPSALDARYHRRYRNRQGRR